MFRSEKWCRRQRSYLRFTFQWPLLNKGLKKLLRPRGGNRGSPMLVARTQLVNPWVWAWSEEDRRMQHLPLRGNTAWSLLSSVLGCQRGTATEADSWLCEGWAPAAILFPKQHQLYWQCTDPLHHHVLHHVILGTSFLTNKPFRQNVFT